MYRSVWRICLWILELKGFALTDSGSLLSKLKLKLADFCEAPLYMPHPHYNFFVRVAILTVKGLPFALEREWLTKES